MRITLVAAGTTGDVLPFVAVGRALVAEGHRVSLATHTDFEALTRAGGMEFRPIGGSFQALMETPAGRAWIESGDNPVRYFRTTKATFGPLLEAWCADTHAACEDCDLIIFHAMAAFAHYTAELRGVPSILMSMVPWVTSGELEHVLVRSPPIFRRVATRMIWRANQRAFWRLFGDYHNAHRESIGLERLDEAPFERMLARGVPHLHLYSPSLVPRPDDWPSHVEVNGFCFLDRRAEYEPPQELRRFLEAEAEPPIYVGFGSMTGRDPEELTRLTLDAIERADKRAILLSGWGGLRAADLPQHVLALDSVPHDWLFPRVSAVFHHGGAGTTAAGLRAGRPTGIVAFFGDQPYWGRHVERVGVGAHLNKRKLDVPRLAGLFSAVSSDTGMAERARGVADQLAREDGVASVLRRVATFA